MKKTSPKKLALSQQTIANLSHADLAKVTGGNAHYTMISCYSNRLTCLSRGCQTA